MSTSRSLAIAALAVVGAGFVVNLLLTMSDSTAVSQAGTVLFLLAVPLGLLLLAAAAATRVLAARRARRARRREARSARLARQRSPRRGR